MLEVKTNTIQLRMDDNNLKFSFGKGDTEWNWTSEYRPKMECKEGTVYFDEALEIHHELVQNGIGKGIRSSFAGFEIEGKKVPYAFETYAWIEECTEDIFFEWIPICEEGLAVEKLFWPGELELEEKRKDWYTLLNMQQGVMIPNDWETELKDIPFDGFFETAGGYMPWFAQFKGGNGYIAICTTPWNAGYQAEHPQNGPYTHVSVRFEPSLGRMDYRRIVRYTLIEDGDYNDACKIYRQYVKEQGNLCTLNEKAARVPSVNDLIGCSFIHKGIKTFVQPESDFFDPENPEKNNNLTSFAVRTREMKELHELGAGKLYLHLDGWAEPGYDNNHPTMMVLTVTLHNIPEGMAVGVVYAGYLAGNAKITVAAAMALSIGIAIQNFPEGAIISMPLRAEGMKVSKAFAGGVLSGIVEPVGAMLTILAAGYIVPALPYLLSFAAGAMIYVVVEELIPEMSQGEHSDLGTIFFAVGFTVMMSLDVALG